MAFCFGIFVVPFPEFPYRGRAAVERVVILEIPAFYSPWIGLQFLSTLPEGPRPWAWMRAYVMVLLGMISVSYDSSTYSLSLAFEADWMQWMIVFRHDSKCHVWMVVVGIIRKEIPPNKARSSLWRSSLRNASRQCDTHCLEVTLYVLDTLLFDEVLFSKLSFDKIWVDELVCDKVLF